MEKEEKTKFVKKSLSDDFCKLENAFSACSSALDYLRKLAAVVPDSFCGVRFMPELLDACSVLYDLRTAIELKEQELLSSL